MRLETRLGVWRLHFVGGPHCGNEMTANTMPRAIHFPCLFGDSPFRHMYVLKAQEGGVLLFEYTGVEIIAPAS